MASERSLRPLLVIIGGGGMGTAIARRLAPGMQILAADRSRPPSRFSQRNSRRTAMTSPLMP